MSLKHDDLYARAWEYDYDQTIFEAEKTYATPPNLHEIQLQSDVSTEETRNTPGTANESSPEFFHQTEELCDVTDTYPDNPGSSKCNLRHNPKPNYNDDYRY